MRSRTLQNDEVVPSMFRSAAIYTHRVRQKDESSTLRAREEKYAVGKGYAVLLLKLDKDYYYYCYILFIMLYEYYACIINNYVIIIIIILDIISLLNKTVGVICMMVSASGDDGARIFL